MATYVIKRKTKSYSGEVIGGIASGVGKALDSKPAAIGGAIIGGAKLGGLIGGLMPIGGKTLGTLIGAGIGAAATRGLGKGLQDVGT